VKISTNLSFYVNELNLDVFKYNLFLNEMVVNLNVFGPLLKDKIRTDMKNSLIVTYKCHLSNISKL